MSERPIIMQGESVRAILEGRKTQTRRVVNPKYIPASFDEEGEWASESVWRRQKADVCPYGRRGDRLWVREAWHTDERDLKAARAQHEDVMSSSPIYYAATETKDAGYIWRSPLHMPRWAARLVLEITEVRVQRLQTMTPEDARAEAGGVVGSFTALWDALNARRGFPWSSNPWVWALTFRRIEVPHG